MTVNFAGIDEVMEWCSDDGDDGDDGDEEEKEGRGGRISKLADLNPKPEALTHRGRS